MRLQRTFFALLSVVVLSLMLVGCANPEEVAPTPSPDQGTGEPPSGSSTNGIVGDWIVISVQENQVATSVVPTVSFAEEGVVSGEAGCNTFGGTYTTDESNGIVLSGITSTLIACDDEAITNQETAVLDALQKTTLYILEGDSLTLTDDSGTALLVLNRDA